MASTRAPERPVSPLWEFRAPAELGLFIGLAAALLAAPRGTGRPVLVLPGFCMNDRSTAPLRAMLGRLGHRPLGWHQGRNMGPTRAAIAGLTELLERTTDSLGEPIPLVGWSLGGLYARALAQWHPDRVDQVISLGSPFNIATNEKTTVSPLYDRLEKRGEFIRNRDDIDLSAIPCPSSSIFTRTDGIVAWRSCRQTSGPEAENIEVRGSHIGLGVNVAATFAVADRLSRPAETWQPFHPPSVLRGLYPRRSCDN